MLHKKTPLIRASSVAKIMTEPRSKADKDAGLMSETAKSHLFDLVKQAFYERDFHFSNKYTCKGLMCEDESIALYNTVHGTNLLKVADDDRAYLDGLTGCPDLILSDGKRGVDIKTAWSLETFPMLPCEVDAKGYDWQARAYMALYDCESWQIAYCLVDTPDELLKYVSDEELAVHKGFEFVPAKHRITWITYKRDYDEEAKMFERVKKARDFMSDLLFKMEGK